MTAERDMRDAFVGERKRPGGENGVGRRRDALRLESEAQHLRLCTSTSCPLPHAMYFFVSYVFLFFSISRAQGNVSHSLSARDAKSLALCWPNQRPTSRAVLAFNHPLIFLPPAGLRWLLSRGKYRSVQTYKVYIRWKGEPCAGST